MKILIGTSGYSYKDWRGLFYPEGVAQRKWLEFYAAHFPVVELNVTFYRLPPETTFAGWRDRTPEAFGFVLKGGRDITHYGRLQGVEDRLKTFLERAVLLGGKLKGCLWQLPPNLTVDTGRLEEFCAALEAQSSPSVFHAFEFRHPSWFGEETWAVLRGHRMSPVAADYPFLCQLHQEPLLPGVERRAGVEVEPTGAVLYVRLHGPGSLYASGYTEEQLRHLVGLFNRIAAPEAYVFFNNDVGGHAVRNAQQLRELVG